MHLRHLSLLPLAFVALVPVWMQVQGSAHAQNVEIIEYKPHGKHPTMGPDDAPVTLEFFLHLGDAHSRRANELVSQLAVRHPKRLRVIYRLTEKSKRSSSLAQNFGREAFAQGRFFEFLAAYYQAHKPYPRAAMYPEVAMAAKVNYKRVEKALRSMEHEKVFRENYYYWRRAAVGRVPGFRFNGRNTDRVRSIEKLEELYDQAFRDSKELGSRGIAPRHVARHVATTVQESRFANKRFRGPLDHEPEDPPLGPSPVSIATLGASTRWRGEESAPLTLVFICHFQSILCRGMSRNLDDIRGAYPTEVRVVFRPFFNSEQPGQDKASLIHQAAECAGEQSAFWEFYQHAFDNQRRISFDHSLAVELASSRSLDLDIPQFEECLESGRHLESLHKELALVEDAGIAHTPALVIGGVAYWGRLHFSDIRMLVNHALRPGLLERLGSP